MQHDHAASQVIGKQQVEMVNCLQKPHTTTDLNAFIILCYFIYYIHCMTKDRLKY